MVKSADSIPMTVQPYQPKSHGETVAAWWEAHTGRRFQSALLPPVGVVAMDDAGAVGACWLHLSAGIGVAFMENPVTRPGLGYKAAKGVLAFMFAALEVVAIGHDYGMIVVHPIASGQRFMESLGFSFLPGKYITGSKILR